MWGWEPGDSQLLPIYRYLEFESKSLRQKLTAAQIKQGTQSFKTEHSTTALHCLVSISMVKIKVKAENSILAF